MANQFLKTAFTNSVKEIQALMGSRKNYARLETGPTTNHELTENEMHFIRDRDNFYMASLSETDWPYIQHRGGPQGFIQVLSPTEIGFVDFAGNRQYISVGNLEKNNRVALILVDYPSQARLKILGEARIVDLSSHRDLITQLTPANYKAKVERAFIIRIEAYDWNCPQHIAPRWTASEIQTAIIPLKKKIQELEEELALLKQG
jgi:uncharacterized protein